MLATYSLGNNQDANHMALIALHVGNLQGYEGHMMDILGVSQAVGCQHARL